jgi:hypothetical protein
MLNNLIKQMNNSYTFSNKKINGSYFAGASVLENNIYSFNKVLIKKNSVDSQGKSVFQGQAQGQVMPLYLNGSEQNKYNAISIINSFFKSIFCLNSQSIFTMTPNKIIIQICFYSPLNKYFIGRQSRYSYSNPKFNKNLNNKKSRGRALGLKLKLRYILTSIYKLNNRFYRIRGSVPAPRNSLLINKKVLITKTNPNLKLINRNSIKNISFKFEQLAIILSDLLQNNVELVLVPLKYPYHDSHILAQLITLNTKKYKFDRIIRKLFQKAPILQSVKKMNKMNILTSNLSTKSLPKNKGLFNSGMSPIKRVAINSNSKQNLISKLTGIKIKIAGRLITQRVVPKKTIKTDYKGSFIKSKNNIVNTATLTSKNKNGAFTVSVMVSHGVFN